MGSAAHAIALVLDVAVETDEARSDDAGFAEDVLREAIERARDDLPPATRAVYISLVLTGDAEIAAINKEHRAVDGPTDALSFPQWDVIGEAPIDDDRPLVLGDIVVSLPRAVEQAACYGHSRAREFGFLLVHGLLHLLGYDHEAPGDAEIMEARQEAVLRVLGLHRDPAQH